MDHIFAKIGKLHYRLIAGETLFQKVPIVLDNCLDYSADHNLDEDSWFKIKNFHSQDYCPNYLKNPFDSRDYNDLQKNQFDEISYVFCEQGGDFYFQKVTKAKFIRKKMIVFGDIAEIEKNNKRLVINDLPDAIYYKNEDSLIFKSLTTINSIFTGVDILYKEATAQEVESFLSSSFIKIKGSYNSKVISKPNRKRIALALNTLTKMSDQDKVDMHTYINEYTEGKLKYEEASSKYEISNDDELKYLLYGIEQRFYTTPFTNEKKLANSVISIA